MQPMSDLTAYPTSRSRPHGTRAAILRAAQDLFGERPWGAVSMEAIAERSGFSRRTVYNQFIDCGELYRATREALIRDISQRLPHEVDAEVEPALALQEFCIRVAAALSNATHVELFRSMVRDGWANPWLLEEYHRWVRGPIIRALELYFYELTARLMTRELDVKREAQQLVADIEGIVVAPQMVPGLLSFNPARVETIDDLIRAFSSRHLGAATSH